MRRLFVLTPCVNAERYIDGTIQSIVSQSGDFSVRYHIQDGGSTDGTVGKIEQWADRLKRGHWPLFCRELEFTYLSSRDEGLYDAINKGFSACAGDAPDESVMTWINAGDRLEQGALQAITSIGRAFPDMTWLSGNFAQINDEGSAVFCRTGGTAYSKKAINAGLYEGRLLGFIQQEGSFWSLGLWRANGGRIDPALKRAGDFDLWRRFAAHAECARVNAITGFFRQHAGGLSSDRDAYYKEIDALLGADGRMRRDNVIKELQDVMARRDIAGLLANGLSGTVVTWNMVTGRWERAIEPIKAQWPRID
ncbi:glycosyltransferase [Sulfuricaulis sp.]|jgi:glycosyltransferase involved in cell wall biosynthesis|uniref:glycosyltransferase n=1 Tax=Sulfuricaulis sp. TaxID=2003553 RepID=UPI00355AB28F